MLRAVLFCKKDIKYCNDKDFSDNCAENPVFYSGYTIVLL